MVRTLSALIAAAAAAFAFTPSHLVVAEEAVIYDEDHNYDDDYIIERLPYWTPVAAEAVGSRQSPRTYCLVTLADGRRGLTEWDNVGRAFVIVAEEALLVGVPAVAKTKVAALKKGEIVAETGPPATDADRNPTWFQVVTEEGDAGWVSAQALGPLAPQAGDFDAGDD